VWDVTVGQGLGYAFLSWFLEHTLPNEYGSNRPLWFLCTREYWRQSKAQENYTRMQEDADADAAAADGSGGGGGDGAAIVALQSSPDGPPSHIEPMRSSAHKPRVFIRHLHKVWTHGNKWWHVLTCSTKKKGNEVVAVKDLNLTMYEGQITCLLGHNGAGSVHTHVAGAHLANSARIQAGQSSSLCHCLFVCSVVSKSTTISMLTGLFGPTSGGAFINGYSINSQMPQIRKHLGIVPQHNVLWSGGGKNRTR